MALLPFVDIIFCASYVVVLHAGVALVSRVPRKPDDSLSRIDPWGPTATVYTTVARVLGTTGRCYGAMNDIGIYRPLVCCNTFTFQLHEGMVAI